MQVFLIPFTFSKVNFDIMLFDESSQNSKRYTSMAIVKSQIDHSVSQKYILFIFVHIYTIIHMT